MRNWIVFLVAVLAAGCASASVSAPSLSVAVENQEERVQKLLIGTWEGYVKDNIWARIEYRDRTLVIYRILRKGQEWAVNANLNRESLEYINLYIYNNTVMLEMMDRYGGFYTLQLYKNTHLLGKTYYGNRAGVGHEAIFEKLSR